jgi:crotonobetainyl-CoA:carnitine CoA-transferase CaiB-like acyl-CoA transferase
MADALGVRDIRFEPGYDPDSPETAAFNERLLEQLQAMFRERTTEEWLEVLDAAGVPAGPVRFIEELLEDPQVVANGLVVELEHAQVGPVKMVGPLVKMSSNPLKATEASPTLGQHTAEILTSLGYDGGDIQRLRESGVTR